MDQETDGKRVPRTEILSHGAATVGGELTIDRLRVMVQDSHLNFLIGAGTPSAYFGLLGDVETALTEIAAMGDSDAKRVARASVQAVIVDSIVGPNVPLMNGDPAADPLVTSYSDFLRTLNRILLRRRSSLLPKQANIFTTNFDLAFETAFERLGLEYNDGFSGKITPVFNLGNFGSLRFRQSARFENQSEVPTFNLYKLHGSAGWRVGKPNEDGLEDIRFDRKVRGIQKAVAARAAATADLVAIKKPLEIDVPSIQAAAGGLALTPAVGEFLKAFRALPVVNPDKRKFATTVLNETYYELIRRFANELEKENCVLFAHGFSFRDEHLRSIVLRAARNNPTLQVIVFCHSDGARADYEKLMPSTLVKNGNIAYVVPVDDGEAAGPLDLDTTVKRFFAPLVPDPERMPDQRVDVQITLKQDPDPGA